MASGSIASRSTRGVAAFWGHTNTYGPVLSGRTYDKIALAKFIASPPACTSSMNTPCMPNLLLLGDEIAALGAFLMSHAPRRGVDVP